MKTQPLIAAIFTSVALCSPFARAATTIDPANNFAYGANVGWINSRGDTANGAVIGEYVCSGYLYSANLGWINLGSGAPANGIYYQNLSGNDFGVNQDGVGNLRGFAYGANIGWLNFETNGAPKVDIRTGNFSGSVWSANCGWISLSNAVAFVQTDRIAPGVDTTADGIPDAWALQNFGTVSINPNADPDHDGMSNLKEYLAGTNPNDPNDKFRLTFIAREPFTVLEWTSQPSRFYAIQIQNPLNPAGPWTDFAVLQIPGINNAVFTDTNHNNFYRLRAFRPLVH